ncbi:PhnA domain-containing protein [Flagellimonas sediminis]|uniref:PhnA protein n=1 Tax=Flagellimonas sediminis TaxID=2696468 RepID=A0A6I5KQX2_9FLAO|nr:alkylphosphonate utilization protein [Allomuricauda sediminis]NDV43176.1 PhnA protein [Allomuricauda sediminis]
MGLLEDLQNRSGNQCELCGATEDLKIYEVPPVSTGGLDGSVLACATCLSQIEDPETVDSNHWRCLNDSMWSEQDAVKVVAWRMLNRLKSEGWPQDLLDMMYLEDEVLVWAKATGEGQDAADMVVHRDSNGVVLENGDNVVLIKDLKVKGSSMVAKQGTAVRRISLDRENAEYIEGKVDGQQIVILTKYVKKL